jgi:histidyl-tRNA synthetase
MASKIQTLPGFRDFPPEACSLRNFLFRKWRQTAVSFGFQEYDGPVLEPLELFTEKSGPEIVTQLFNFEDKGGRQVSLRPELTPTLARMVGANAGSIKRPVKWFAIAECFRFEKQQKGRKRSFYQFNADILGEAGAGADAELIALCIESMRAFGLGPEHFVVRLSDRTLWMEFLAGLGLDEAASIKTLSVVDKMERVDMDYTREQLLPVFGAKLDEFLRHLMNMRSIATIEELETWVCSLSMPKLTERMTQWSELWNTLSGMDMSEFCRVDLSIVRGLAYYTGFVFEVFERFDLNAIYQASIEGKLSSEIDTRTSVKNKKCEIVGRAIAGGGRYDKLVEKLGYQPMHASGFAVGDVTLSDLLESAKLLPPLLPGVDCYVVMGEGEAERKAGLNAVATLRNLGIGVDYAIKPMGFGKQFKTADQSGAKLTLIFGGDEVAQGNFKMRDMASGGEAMGPIADLADGVRMRLNHGIEKA